MNFPYLAMGVFVEDEETGRPTAAPATGAAGVTQIPHKTWGIVSPNMSSWKTLLREEH